MSIPVRRNLITEDTLLAVGDHYTPTFGMVEKVTMTYFLKAETGATPGSISLTLEGRLPDGTWAQPGVDGDEGEILSTTSVGTGLNFFDRIAGMPYLETCRIKITVADEPVTINHLIVETA